ncbi:type II toxin-antitoxin system RelE/ParE family toxin [Paraburkholderia sp. 31.1]|uniref:type II toxin-antitoxin system RelE/ParE family toxin n=1 Tax=Paraburkholderia sp. 31.1 TaxID=2615205 RepID=UPI00292A52D1|nr:type II toxin-antitoxin system RelE/ParE family toxin [Paraburkholderia sp. 31.1]
MVRGPGRSLSSRSAFDNRALARGLKTGRICSVRAGYWRYTAGSHVIFYQDTDHTLDVIRILHQRMDVDRHL